MWEMDISAAGSSGVIQHALTRAEFKLGFPKLLTLHSPRAWYATCAAQLLFSLEQREKLCHWQPGSIMPDTYDRAVCAVELRLRNSILNRVDDGWQPADSFEVPDDGARKGEELQSSSSDSTPQSPTASFIAREKENIADLGRDDPTAGSQKTPPSRGFKFENFV